MIDRSGQWWRGDNFADLVEYVRAYTASNYPVGGVVQSRCRSCDATTFTVRVDDEQGCAVRECVACDASAFIADSEEYADDADLGDASCPCGAETFEVGVGFSLREDGDVRGITVGGRCVACGVLGAYADWKIDYSPTAHLLDAV